MTALEKYNQLTPEQRVAIADSETYLMYAEQCMEAIAELCREKEIAVLALLETYTHYKREEFIAEKVLTDAGFTDKEIILLRAGYFGSQN